MIKLAKSGTVGVIVRRILVPFLCVAVPVSILVLMVIGTDPQLDTHAEDQYCSMVALWEEEAVAGVKPNERSGWPPFKGGCVDK